MSKKWYAEGIKFQCQGSGFCCTSHGEFGFVFLTLKDRQNMAKLLKLSTRQFTNQYCAKTNGVFHLIERKDNLDCLFLKNKRCTVYAARPTQCRTWPFWPDTMGAKAWTKEVVAFCPGVGKGTKTYSAQEIDGIVESQAKWEDRLVRGL